MIPFSTRARIISVASGKGGAGKTNVAVNLAVAFAQAGDRTLLIDCDMGLANAAILLGMPSAWTIGDLLAGRCELDDLMQNGPAGRGRSRLLDATLGGQFLRFGDARLLPGRLRLNDHRLRLLGRIRSFARLAGFLAPQIAEPTAVLVTHRRLLSGVDEHPPWNRVVVRSYAAGQPAAMPCPSTPRDG